MHPFINYVNFTITNDVRVQKYDVIMYSKQHSIAVSLLALTKYVSSKYNICRNKHLHIIISVITYSYQFTAFSTCENTLFYSRLKKLDMAPHKIVDHVIE